MRRRGLTAEQEADVEVRLADLMEDYRRSVETAELYGERFLEPEAVEVLCADMKSKLRTRLEDAARYANGRRR